MDYRVVFVNDDELPWGHDWAMLRAGAHVVFAVKRTRVTPLVLEEAWGAYRLLAQRTPALRAAV